MAAELGTSVATLVIVTLAPGIAAPYASLTTPLIEAWFDCPNSRLAAKQTNSSPLNIPMSRYYILFPWIRIG